MADPYVHAGQGVDDIHGQVVRAGVDYDCVMISVGASKVVLNAGQCEHFARIFVAAVWQAATQQADTAAIMRADAEDERIASLGADR